MFQTYLYPLQSNVCKQYKCGTKEPLRDELALQMTIEMLACNISFGQIG